ncbi:MAG: tetratricopeptide repeat protein [Sandaracinus sp.]|nr:tetratricopeptide repeat protein [Sandaracinus sp.]
MSEIHLPTVPLVGRGPELRELEEALARALSTKTPQTVTLVGSPGIGKTRLLDDLLVKLRERERRLRVFRAQARENASAQGLVARILRQRFRIPETMADAEAKKRLREEVEQILGNDRVDEFLFFLGAFLDLDFADSPFTKALEDDPRELRRVSQAVLRRAIEVDAQQQPMVLVFDDVHQAQDDALDLLEYLAMALRDAPVLVILAARPEILARRVDFPFRKPPPSDHEKYGRRIELAPLSNDESASLLLKLLDPVGDVPDDLVDAGVEVAGGSPYLLEQMVRAYFDAGVLRVAEEGRWEVELSRLDDAQLPLTVEQAISARISSLTPAERELLERASTMGGVFWLGALVALSRLDAKAPELWGGHESLVAHYEEMLSSLAERDYVLPMPDSAIPGERELAFKHNLEREMLHRLTNRTQMRRYHRVVAEWLDLKLPMRGEEQLEMLANHYEEGGLDQRAGLLYLDAGDRARARYANVKAAESYERGLELLGEGQMRRRLDALHGYGDVLQLAGRNDDALNAFREMLGHAFRLDQKSKGGVAHNRIGRLFRSIGHLDEAMRHLGTGQALFVAADDQRGVASSIDDIGKVHWLRGSYEPAERFFLRALDIRRELAATTPSPELARSIALSLNNLGLVYQDSGRFEEARRAFEEALHLRQEIGDRPGIAQTLNNLGTIHQDDGDEPRAIELFREALEVARQVGDRMRQAVILTNLGETQYRLGTPDDAIATLTEAEQISRTLGDRILEGEILRGLAKAHNLAHDFTTARDYIARSIVLFEQARGKPFLGVAFRTLGEITAAAGWGGEDHAHAREAFRKSIALFEELGNQIELARSLEAHAVFLEQGGETKADPVAMHEAMQLRGRADEIRSRLRESESYELEPLEGESTQPGVIPPKE